MNNNRNNNNCCDDVEFATLNETPGMAPEAKAASKNAAQRYRSQSAQNNQYASEFASSNPSVGMSQGAKASSQFAAQKYRNQNQQTTTPTSNQYSTEFGTAQKAYGYMSEEAKAGTKAAKRQYGQQYSQEFAQGQGGMSAEAKAKSQETAKQMKNYTPRSK